jgi:glycosyltransferase involved in cell wall biosynthesis
MRILLVTPMPPQPHGTGAIPVMLHMLLVALRPRHTVTLVTVVGSDPAEWQAVERLRASGMEVHAVKLMQSSNTQRWQRRWRLASSWLRGRYPWRTIWFREPGLQQILDDLLAQKRFDLIQVEDNAMGVYRYRTTVPIVFTEHEVRRPRPIQWRKPADQGRISWALSELDWQRWQRYHRAVWKRFDRIQVFTTRDAARIRSMAPEVADRVRVNPFGIELPKPSEPGLEQGNMVVFVGNFTHLPNVDAALWLGHEIMPRLRELCPGVRLSLVGIYPPPNVMALACGDIVVTGAVPRIEPFLEQAAVVLAPLRVGGGMRMKVLYAMAMGKAVVTTSRGADGLAIGDQLPPLVVAEGAEEIAQVIAALLKSDERRCAIGRRARAFVAENFSAAAYAQRIEAIWAELQALSAVGNS